MRSSYRFRARVAHLREARRFKKKTPARFAKLQGIIDQMILEPEEQSESGMLTPPPLLDQADTDLEIFEVPLKTTTDELIDIDGNSDDEYIFEFFRSDSACSADSSSMGRGSASIARRAALRRASPAPARWATTPTASPAPARWATTPTASPAPPL